MDRRSIPRPILVLGTVLIVGLSSILVGRTQRALSAPPRRGWQAGTSSMPIAFIPNRGQVNAQVRYLAHAGSSTIFLTDTGMTILGGRGRGSSYDRAPAGMRLSFAGAAQHPSFACTHRLPETVNFFLGNDPRYWRTDLPTYAAVSQNNVYRGIDLIYRGTPGLEYDWMLRPGADPNLIRMLIEGSAIPSISPAGNLMLHAGGNVFLQSKPRIYTFGGRTVEGGFVLHGRTVGFRLGHYDHTKPLVIDPRLSYSTYLGGTGSEQGLAVAADANGDTYIAGATTSDDFPTRVPLQSRDLGDGNAFVGKINRAGTAMVYSTYIGGSSTDEALAIAVDRVGSAYITGDTMSDDYPIVNAFQAANRTQCTVNGNRVPCPNALVTKLSPKGDKLIYSTYLGGDVTDEGDGIAVDAAGNAYLAGKTFSTDFPTSHPLQAHSRSVMCLDETSRRSACSDAWVAKLNAAGSALIYSTYLGGSKNDEANGIAVDIHGNAYICGDTYSPDFPVVRPIQRESGISRHTFVSELNSHGSALIYSTYIGGRKDDVCINIAVRHQSAYITGYTWSSDFPTTPGAMQRTERGLDAFVTKFQPGGGTLAYSTVLGGTGNDEAFGIAVDRRNRAYIVGDTQSTDFPTRHAAQPSYAGKTDAFVSELNAAGSALVQSTYLGGKESDYGHGIALDPEGNAYVIGFTYSRDFPTVHAIRGATGDTDAFVARIGDRVVPLLPSHHT